MLARFSYLTWNRNRQSKSMFLRRIGLCFRTDRKHCGCPCILRVVWFNCNGATVCVTDWLENARWVRKIKWDRETHVVETIKVWTSRDICTGVTSIPSENSDIVSVYPIGGTWPRNCALNLCSLSKKKLWNKIMFKWTRSLSNASRLHCLGL